MFSHLKHSATVASSISIATSAKKFQHEKNNQAFCNPSLLIQPGIFGVISTFKLKNHEKCSDDIAKSAELQLIHSIIEEYKHKDLHIEFYLTSGISSTSDYFVRVHGKELICVQNFLLDFKNRSQLGKSSEVKQTFIGVSRPLNYITPAKSVELNSSLFATTYSSGPPKYAIVVPVKKNAKWWNLSDSERLAMTEEHTRATLFGLKSVKRKLYHSTGLDDVDFITYFETDDLLAFQELMLALVKVKENTHHVRWGEPTIVAAIKSIDEIVDVLL